MNLIKQLYVYRNGVRVHRFLIDQTSWCFSAIERVMNTVFIRIHGTVFFHCAQTL